MKTKITILSIISLLADSANSTDIHDTREYRVFGEPISTKSKLTNKDINKKNDLRLSLKETNFSEEEKTKIVTAGLLWQKILTDDSFYQKFINDHYSINNLSAGFIENNSENIQILKALTSSSIKKYLLEDDYDSFISELQNIGVIDKTTFSSLKERYLNRIKNSSELQMIIPKIIDTRNKSLVANSRGKCAYECHSSGGNGVFIIANVAAGVNVVAAINVAIHSFAVAAVAVAVEGRSAIQDNLIDDISNADIDLKREKSIILSVSKASNKINKLEIERQKKLQLRSFFSASVELGLIELTDEEIEIMISNILTETKVNQ
ncbi:hypothetical protein [Photobacterium damselae]|uniref:hypothetical protein n=1 Tax=Photobacterium damselae TaxID=38293 RepID=UPI0025436B2A